MSDLGSFMALDTPVLSSHFSLTTGERFSFICLYIIICITSAYLGIGSWIYESSGSPLAFSPFE